MAVVADRGRMRGVGAARPAVVDAVGGYLREIARYAPLSRGEQRELFERLARERETFEAAALSLPGTAEALVRRWSELVRAGLSTGRWSARHGEAGARDLGEAIDRRLADVARRLRRAAAARASGAEPGSPDDARIARALGAADLAFAVVVDAFQEGARADAAESAARARQALAAFEATRRVAVERNLRLVVAVARALAGKGVDLADLIQQGNLALIRAVERFDPARGLMFSTYAVWWLHQAMIRTLQRQRRTVRPPSTSFDDLRRYFRAERSLRTRSPTEPRVGDIVREAALSAAACDRVTAALAVIASTQAPLGDGLTLEDTLADEATPDPVGECDRRGFCDALPALLDRLSPRERLIVELRFGLDGREPRTLAELGATLGLSRERVRQIEAAALRRLRLGAETCRLVALAAPPAC